ncbi:MAG: PEGA domain-containing protein [Deltaproteobacteria bacterium]|nr:PEGA domain-containing protein [Deltaproteobacteria bacterium]
MDYSQQPVDDQIQMKSRFNGILAEAIKDVAVNDRIILDTGDGAAISFLGDPEDALFVALNIRDAIIGEDSTAKPRLSARIGINLGPVKLVQDINRQRNLIGDGINVAQRVMSFANPGQVLVSRSYFEVISRLSQEYAKLFHYEGSRADKHVREHQVYSVHPVEKEKSSLPAPPAQRKEEQKQNKEITSDDVSTFAADIDAGGQRGKTVTAGEGQPLTFQPSFWKLAWEKMLRSWNVKRFNWNALRKNRMMLYVAAAMIVTLIGVPVIVWKIGRAPVKDPGTVPSSTSVAAPEVTKKAGTSAKAKKVEIPAVAKKAGPPAKAEKAESATPVSEDQKKPEMATTLEEPAVSATVSLGIAPWGEVYVDGQKKGVSPPLNKLRVAPGKHTIEIRNTTFPPYKQTVDLKPGEQLRIKHKFL